MLRGENAMKRIKHAFFIVTLITSFYGRGLADEHWAVSLSPADVQAAVNAASPGDTVVLPAGDYSGFNTPVDIYSQISLRGQGKNSTILRKTSTNSGWGAAMFRWCMYRDESRNQMVNINIEIKDFTLYGKGGYDLTTEDQGIFFHNVVYGTKNFKIHDVNFNRFGEAGILTDGWPFYGVIYNCNFSDCYLPGLGYGVSVRLTKYGESYDGITAYNANIDWGQFDWIYIEDCTFSNCRHCVTGSIGGRFVVRYCNMTPANDWIAAICAHGYSDNPILYGTSAMDLYNNTISLLGPTVNEAWIWIYGGAVRAHDNTITGTRWNQGQVTYVNDPSVASGPISYPHLNQATDIYLWNNTIDGSIRNATVYNPYGYVGSGKVWQEGRDFFYYAPSGYTTYPYPHPLRQGTPHLSLSPASLQFSAIAGGSKPANKTFQISNSGGGTLNWSVSDNANWLTCSPTSGTNGASITVSVDQTGLSAGTYNANISISSGNADNSPQNLSVSLTVTASAPPLSASVMASPTSGQAPLAVNFTGSASGGATPYSYRWTFGDGGSSTSQNPSHTYSSAGTYTATLTVTDSTNATNSKSLTITVTFYASQLTATASADPTSGLAPLSVNFSGSATGGMAPYTYSWNFGDGGTSSTQNPSYTYTAIGSYAANLTVTDSVSSTVNATVDIAVQSTSAANLALAAETGSPAPGQGGTTDPSPGNYSYSIGTTVSVKSVPNTDYRFSKWSGDIIDSSMFSSATALTMDKSKSLSGTFCTKCADVNGDLRITPADAQLAFDIYLGRVASPTWCELENADVNSSGTKLAPKVTPSDAQTIFHKFLRRKVASSDCSGSSRAAALSMQTAGFTNVNLTINNVTFAPGQDILIPVIIESPSEIKAFGFDLSFPSDILTYVGLESAELTKDYDQLDANVIYYQTENQGPAKTEPAENLFSGFRSVFSSKIFMPQALDSREPLQDFDQPIANMTNSRVLRVGGYKTSSTVNPSSGVLVTLIFRVTGEVKDQSSISVIATYDDIQNATIRNGMPNSQNSFQAREDQKQVRDIERKFAGKRYDF
jgi:PKD repeat protein